MGDSNATRKSFNNATFQRPNSILDPGFSKGLRLDAGEAGCALVVRFGRSRTEVGRAQSAGSAGGFSTAQAATKTLPRVIGADTGHERLWPRNSL